MSVLLDLKQFHEQSRPVILSWNGSVHKLRIRELPHWYAGLSRTPCEQRVTGVRLRPRIVTKRRVAETIQEAPQIPTSFHVATGRFLRHHGDWRAQIDGRARDAIDRWGVGGLGIVAATQNNQVARCRRL